MKTIVLADDGLVVAVFLTVEHARIFASATHHEFCVVPFNEDNLAGTPLPKVGDVYRV